MRMQPLFCSTLQFRSLAIVAFVLIFNAQATSCGQEIAWYPDVKTAVKAASEQDKLVLMHFTANWCRPCRTLETFVFNHPSVEREFHDNVIAVKIDVDADAHLVQEYGVSTVPFDIAVTPSGRVVSKRRSPQDATAYQKMLADFGKIINGLANAENPALNQNLAEIQELMQNQNPSFEGQPTSFTPDTPSHPAPSPSRDSAELKRKSQIINNPYLQPPVSRQPTPPPQQVANAFQPIQKADRQASPNNLASEPKQVPNQTAPINPASPIQSSPMTSPQVQIANQHPPAVQSPNHNDFVAPNVPQDPSSKTTMNNNGFVPSNPANEVQTKPQDVSSLKLAHQPLERPKEAVQPIVENKRAAPKAEASRMMDDKYFGDISSQEIDNKAQDNSSQAKITLPKTNDFLAPAANDPRGEATAQIVVDPNDNQFQKQRTRSRNASSSTNTASLNMATKTPAKPKYALHGKCPVTLLTQSKWVDGDSRWGCVHRNRIYVFANEDNLSIFQSDPDAHSPILAGYDPVIFRKTGRLVDGLEKHGVFMGNAPHQRIVLFASDETRAQFQLEPRQYLESVRQAMKSSGGASSKLIR